MNKRFNAPKSHGLISLRFRGPESKKVREQLLHTPRSMPFNLVDLRVCDDVFSVLCSRFNQIKNSRSLS
jgi:hypothetical protein